MKFDNLKLPTIEIEVRSDRTEWSEKHGRQLPANCIEVEREKAIRELDGLKDEEWTKDPDNEEHLAELHRYLVDTISECDRLEQSGADIFAARLEKSQIDAPFGRIPQRVRMAPHLVAWEFDEEILDFRFRGFPQPVSFWEAEILDIGDGIFVFGEIYNDIGFCTIGRLVLRNPMSKKGVFYDLLRFVQALWDMNEFESLPTIESAEQLAVQSDLLACAGVHKGALVIGYRESRNEEFMGCTIGSCTNGAYEPDCDGSGDDDETTFENALIDSPNRFIEEGASIYLQDILGSLQWGFRGERRNFENGDYQKVDRPDLDLTGLVWRKVMIDADAQKMPMKGYLQADSDDYFDFALKSLATHVGFAAYTDFDSFQQAYHSLRDD